MKKAMLFALAALCVSAAQALTISWNPTNANGANQDYQFDLSKADRTQNLTFSIVLNATDNPATNNVFWNMTFNGNDHNKDSILLYRDGNGTASLQIKGSDSSQVAIELADMFPVLNANLGTNYTLTFDYNLSTSTLSNVMFNNTQYGTSITKDNVAYATDGKYLSDAMNGGKFHITNVSVGYTAVPEPTALALLALGVAGLALKRKVA